jgi:hypothetical protein
MVLGDNYQMRNKMIVLINNKYVDFLNKNK